MSISSPECDVIFVSEINKKYGSSSMLHPTANRPLISRVIEPTILLVVWHQQGSRRGPPSTCFSFQHVQDS